MTDQLLPPGRETSLSAAADSTVQARLQGVASWVLAFI